MNEYIYIYIWASAIIRLLTKLHLELPVKSEQMSNMCCRILVWGRPFWSVMICSFSGALILGSSHFTLVVIYFPLFPPECLMLCFGLFVWLIAENWKHSGNDPNERGYAGKWTISNCKCTIKHVDKNIGCRSLPWGLGGGADAFCSFLPAWSTPNNCGSRLYRKSKQLYK